MAPLAVAWLFGLACGPQVELEDDGASTGAASSTGSVETTTSATTTSPSTGSSVTDPMETATTTGVDPDESGSSTGVVFPEWCSTYEQDCPRGYKCMPWANDGGSWNDKKCVPIVDDPSAPGEPCTVVGSGTSGEDDCDGTSMCWDVDSETNSGVCQPFCIGTQEEPTCADPCASCAIAADGIITLCFDTCDPLLQSCGPGRACYPFNGQFYCARDASPEGTGIADPCAFEGSNTCPSGMACIGGVSVPGCEAGHCCTPYCTVGGADPCPGLLPGSSCVPWFEEGEAPPMECQSALPGLCLAQ